MLPASGGCSCQPALPPVRPTQSALSDPLKKGDWEILSDILWPRKAPLLIDARLSIRLSICLTMSVLDLAMLVLLVQEELGRMEFLSIISFVTHPKSFIENNNPK